MKRGITLLAVLLVVAVTSDLAAQVRYQDPRQRNPTGDRDVERGYQRHQQESSRSESRSVDSSSDTVKAPPSDEGGKPGPGSEGVRSTRPPLYTPLPRSVPAR